MFDKKKKRSASLVRDDIRDMSRDTDWPDSVSMTGDDPTVTGQMSGETNRDMINGARKYSSQLGYNGARHNATADRKTDIEKLYWTTAGDQGHTGDTDTTLKTEQPPPGPGSTGAKRPGVNGFHHSANAAFDEIDKTFWNDKNPGSSDQRVVTALVEKFDQKSRRTNGTSESQMNGYNQTYQQHFGGEVEKFMWNDKVPGEDEEKQSSASERPTKSKMPNNGHSVRKSKLNGMREFQNFNDEEKLYWNEKLHQYSALKQQVNGHHGSSIDLNRASAKDTNSFQTYQNFLDEKLGWNDKVGDMFNTAHNASNTGSGAFQNSKHQQQAGLYRSYLQSYEAAASNSR